MSTIAAIVSGLSILDADCISQSRLALILESFTRSVSLLQSPERPSFIGFLLESTSEKPKNSARTLVKLFGAISCLVFGSAVLEDQDGISIKVECPTGRRQIRIDLENPSNTDFYLGHLIDVFSALHSLPESVSEYLKTQSIFLLAS